MIRIALIESDEKVVGTLSSNFEKEFCAETYVFSHFADYLERGGGLPPCSLFIVRNILDEEETAKKLLNYLYDHEMTTKVIVMGEIEQSSFSFESISSRFRLPELNRLIISTLGVTKEELAEIKLPDFIPVPLPHFYLMSSVPCDIFIRIERKAEEDKYVKRIHSGDTFDKEVIKRYEQNNLKSFYVEKSHRHQFMDALVNQSLGRFDQHSSLDQMVDSIGDAFSITTDLVRNTGLDSHSAKFIDGTLVVMKNIIDQNPRFATLFSQLIRLNGDLSYRHSYLIMVFGSKVLPLLDWVGKDHANDMIQSLMYISFFHDIFLDTPELLNVTSKKQLQAMEITDHQRDLVLNHANLAATLAQKMPHAPVGIDVIIRQHHGTSNGVGFAESNSSSLSKLAIAFIVIEKFVWRLINFEKGKDSMISIFDELKESFTQPSYRNVLEKIIQVVNSSVK